MYQFHYETILAKYGSLARLAYTDTDSFIYHIQTPDLYKDIAENLYAYDTSDYPNDHHLYSKMNAKLLGKMKDECAGQAPHEFVGLRSKMYSIRLPNNKAKFTAKGVSRKYILKHLQHDNFLQTLQTKGTTMETFTTLRSMKQQLKTIDVTKHCLSAADSKRYVNSEGVSPLAYGHYRIKQLQAVDQ